MSEAELTRIDQNFQNSRIWRMGWGAGVDGHEKTVVRLGGSVSIELMVQIISQNRRLYW